LNIRTETWLGHEIRFVEVNPNDWQGIANDVTNALGLKNSRRAIASLPEDQKGVTTVNTLGGEQTVNTVGELGIYQLIFKSRGHSTNFRYFVRRDEPCITSKAGK